MTHGCTIVLDRETKEFNFHVLLGKELLGQLNTVGALLHYPSPSEHTCCMQFVYYGTSTTNHTLIPLKQDQNNTELNICTSAKYLLQKY